MTLVDNREDRPRPSVQEIYDNDSVAPPPVLRNESMIDLGTSDIPSERYLSEEWHRLEVERVWKRVWQVACREESIPKVGDYVVYDIADVSLIVIRSAPDEIRAFRNSCLHRGTTLAEGEGHCDTNIRCPFHGFSWSFAGELSFVPSEWDFTHIDKSSFRLPEARVGTWGGWVFINLDPDSMSLEDYLGGFPDAFPWRQQELYVQAHVAKEHRCNWKVAMEAFLEALHAFWTHPQAAAMLGDLNSQYDVFPNEPRWNRIISPSYVPSPMIGEVTQQDIMDAALAITLGDEAEFPVPEGKTARQVLAEVSRSQVQLVRGPDEPVSDTEAVDSIQYFVFPNFVPWGGWAGINYRFRPVGDSPHRSVMEVILLAPYPPGTERPAPAELKQLGPDESWTEAPELGLFGAIFDQDSANVDRVQRGLAASTKPGVTLSSYQESRIRHFHHELERWVRDDPTR